MQLIKKIIINFYNLVSAMALLVLLPAAATSQPVVKIDNIAGCENTQILIPVEITNMENIAALTLYIKVDTSVVDYVGIENVNEAFSTGEFIGGENKLNQEIILNWMSITAANLESGVMCNIRVLMKNGSTDFTFLDKSEFAYPDLSTVEGVEYVNGSLHDLSDIAPDPLTQSLIEGNNATIELTGSFVGYTMQWQIKTDDNWIDLIDDATYSGVNSAILTINSISKEMNESLYRCVLTNGECSAETTESELLVEPNGIDSQKGRVTDPFRVYPNPADKMLNCFFNKDVLDGEVRLVNLNGVVISRQQLRSITVGEVMTMNVANIKSGVYFLQLYDNSKFVSSVRVLRN
jgi:hypothetical protein